MSDGWNQVTLQKHLQAAVDLELWTIPFYMAAMYSLEDPSGEPYRLIQSIVYQEMLHVQLAANIANAFGLSPTFKKPVYKGKHIPHLDFDLDTPDPTAIFTPYSAEIGPLDIERLNAFCLIEYPEWDTEGEPSPKANIEEYGSIGEFYLALTLGAQAVVGQDPGSLQGDVKQVDLFERFYSAFTEPRTHIVQYTPETQAMKVTESGVQGLRQVLRLMTVITSQGEGQVEGEQEIPSSYRNTADDPEPADAHFAKFNSLRNAALGAENTSLVNPWKTYPLIHHPPTDPKGIEQKEAQERLKRNFRQFLQRLEQLFSGGELPQSFGVEMATLGGNIRRCWQLGVVPTF